MHMTFHSLAMYLHRRAFARWGNSKRYFTYRYPIHYAINYFCFSLGMCLKGYSMYLVWWGFTSLFTWPRFTLATTTLFGGKLNVPTRSPLTPPIYEPHFTETFDNFELTNHLEKRNREIISYALTSRYKDYLEGREADIVMFEGFVADEQNRRAEEKDFEAMQHIEDKGGFWTVAEGRKQFLKLRAEKEFAKIENTVVPDLSVFDDD